MNADYSTLLMSMIERSRRDRLPFMGSFELTSRCNLSCKMCYICAGDPVGAMAGELSGKQWINIAREASAMGMLRLLLTGGEAMMHRDFWEIYEGVSKLGLLITLNTNGVLLTSEVVERLRRMPPRGIMISVYGSSPEAYERVTGSRAAYERIMRGIELLERYDLHYRLRTVMIQDTKDDLNKIIKIFLDHGNKVGLVDYISPTKDSLGNEPVKVRLSPFELREAKQSVTAFIRDYMEKHRIPDEAAEDNEPEEEPLSREDEARKNDADEVSGKKPEPLGPFKCAAGSWTFWVTYDGKLTPCPLMDKPYTEPVKDGFEKAWADIGKACEAVPGPSGCAGCEYFESCGNCPARLYRETGSFDKKAPYLCEYMRVSRS